MQLEKEDTSAEVKPSTDRSKASVKPQSFDSEIEWLLFHLWAKPQMFKFKVPDTVILKQDNLLSNWYFTASQGHILKKNRSNLTTFKLGNKFVNKLNSNFEHVAATAYHYEQKSAKVPGFVQKDQLTLEHIATHDFRSFCAMLEQQAMSSGSQQFKIPRVLQKFVYSKSSKNQMLKCTWASNIEEDGAQQIIIERAFNIHSMYDAKIDLNDRIHTFEAYGAKKASQKVQQALAQGNCISSTEDQTKKLDVNKPPSNMISVCTVDTNIPDFIRLELNEALLQIKDHLYKSYQYDMVGGTFYFKYDKNDDLYLTFVAGLKVFDLSNGPTTQQEAGLSTANKFGLHPNLKSAYKIGASNPSTDRGQASQSKKKTQLTKIFNQNEDILPQQNFVISPSGQAYGKISHRSSNRYNPKASNRSEQSASQEQAPGAPSGILKDNLRTQSNIASIQKQSLQPDIYQGKPIYNWNKTCPVCMDSQQGSEMVYEFTTSYVINLYSRFQDESLNEFIDHQQIPQVPQELVREVPAPIQRMYPHLTTYMKLQKKMQDPAFLYSSIKVCDRCYGQLKEIQGALNIEGFQYLRFVNGVQIQLPEKITENKDNEVINETEREWKQETLLSNIEATRVENEAKDGGDEAEVQQQEETKIQDGMLSEEVSQELRHEVAMFQHDVFPKARIRPQSSNPNSIKLRNEQINSEMKQSSNYEQRSLGIHLGGQHSQPSQSRLKSSNSRMSLQEKKDNAALLNQNRKRFAGINNFFNVKENLIHQQIYKNQQYNGIPRKKPAVNPTKQQQTSVQLMKGQSSMPGYQQRNETENAYFDGGQQFAQQEEIEFHKIQQPQQFGEPNMISQQRMNDAYNVFVPYKRQSSQQRSRPYSSKPNPLKQLTQQEDSKRLPTFIQVSEHVGANSLSKLRTSLSSAGYSKVNFQKIPQQDTENTSTNIPQIESQKKIMKRPQSSKVFQSTFKNQQRPLSSKPGSYHHEISSQFRGPLKVPSISGTNTQAASQMGEYPQPQHGILTKQHVDWEREYSLAVKRKAEESKNAIFNIIDIQFEQLTGSQGQEEGQETHEPDIQEQDLGIQEIDDDDESQDIFDNFDKNQKQKIVTFNEQEFVEVPNQTQVRDASSNNSKSKSVKSKAMSHAITMQEVNKQRKSRGGRGLGQANSYKQHRAQLRRNIVSAKPITSNLSLSQQQSIARLSQPSTSAVKNQEFYPDTNLPPFLQKPQRQVPKITRKKPPKMPQPAGNPLFSFDPHNLKASDLENIAQNADSLISIISNIKKQVSGGAENQDGQRAVNRSQNSDLKDIAQDSEEEEQEQEEHEAKSQENANQEVNQANEEQVKIQENVMVQNQAVQEERKDPDIFGDEDQDQQEIGESAADSDMAMLMINNQINKNTEQWW